MMYADSLLPDLEKLARRAAESEGVDLGWVELKRQAGSWVFRIFIDRPGEEGGVGLDDCERVSKRLSVLLDVEDPIESSYTLEVSTPGLDRPLHNRADYERFAGKLARVKTKQAIDGRKRFLGRLAGVDDDVVVIHAEGTDVRIPFSAIDSGRLEVEIHPPSPRKARRGA